MTIDPVLSLRDSSNWEFFLDVNFEGIPIPNYPGKTTAIESYIIPTLLHNNIISVYAYMRDKPKRWKLAGSVNKRVSINRGTSKEAIAIVENRRIWLDEITLIKFERDTPEYQLELVPAYWIPNIGIRIDVYVGNRSNIITDQLNRVEDKLDRLIPEF